MVPGVFLWFFIVPGQFVMVSGWFYSLSRFLVGFPLFQVGFMAFHGSRWVFMVPGRIPWFQVDLCGFSFTSIPAECQATESL